MKERTIRYQLIMAIKILALGVIAGLLALFSYEAAAWPDRIEFDAKLNQYSEQSALCLGSGMSKNLTSELSVTGVWVAQNDLSFRAGYSKEYCMINNKSDSATKMTLGIGYKLDL